MGAIAKELEDLFPFSEKKNVWVFSWIDGNMSSHAKIKMMNTEDNISQYISYIS